MPPSSLGKMRRAAKWGPETLLRLVGAASSEGKIQAADVSDSDCGHNMAIFSSGR
jgi:hypothetical protein